MPRKCCRDFKDTSHLLPGGRFSSWAMGCCSRRCHLNVWRTMHRLQNEPENPFVFIVSFALALSGSCSAALSDMTKVS